MEIETLSVILILLIVLFVFLSIREAPNPDVHPLLLTLQSDATKVRYPGESAVYRRGGSQHGVSIPEKDVKTLSALFASQAKKDLPCLGNRRGGNGEYVWQTYEQVSERVTNFGSGLIKHTGLAPKDLFGIFMNSRPEWVIADLASSHYSLVTVALPSISPRLADVINQIQLTDIRVIIVSQETLPIIFSASSAYNGLRYIILAGGAGTAITEEQKERASALKLNLCSFEEIEEIGKRERMDYVLAEPKDTATIVFSSGTTSDGPKGVELTHENIVADIAGLLATLQEKQKINSEDRYLSHLPLAHIFERITVLSLLFSRASIAFYGGKLSNVLVDAQEVKPTIFTCTSGFLVGFREDILSTYGKQMLFERGYRSKHQSLKKGQLIKNSLWDMLVFNPIKVKLGGGVRVIVTGGGPISQSTLDFVRITVGCQVIQVYGLTQCSGMVTMNVFYDYQSDGDDSHCGGPLPCNEIKLVDCLEREYSVEDVPNPRGEICVRGTNVMKGYYKRPEETSQVIDADGWLRTGDIGMMLPNGTLKIIGRKL